MTFGADKTRDAALLAARVLLMILFVLFGYSKLTGFGGTVAYFTHGGIPAPTLAALIAVVMEFFVGLALVLGLLTRPQAIIMAVYTLGTGLLGHPFWSMTGAEAMANEINFFKNIAIIGGLLALYVSGAGRYSIDRALKLA